MPKRKFAICRVSKLKTLKNIAGASAHNRREIDTPNADSTVDNIYWGADDPAKKAQEVWEELNIKPRSNAVMGNEYILTASPEFWRNKSKKSILEWTKHALEFVKKKHGPGLLQASLHLDESSPHLQVIITPVYQKPDGTWGLSAKHYFDNPKGRKVSESQKKLSILQTDFAKHMIRHGWNMERGIKGSKAKHKKLRTYYAELEKTLEQARTETELELQNAAEFDSEHDNPGFFSIKRLFQQSKLTIQRLIMKLKRLEEVNAALKKKFDDKVRQMQSQIEALQRDREILDKLFEKTGAENESKAHSLLDRLVTAYASRQRQQQEPKFEPLPKANPRNPSLE